MKRVLVAALILAGCGGSKAADTTTASATTAAATTTSAPATLSADAIKEVRACLKAIEDDGGDSVTFPLAIGQAPASSIAEAVAPCDVALESVKAEQGMGSELAQHLGLISGIYFSHSMSVKATDGLSVDLGLWVKEAKTFLP